MATEREILKQITDGQLTGVSGLLERHESLFRDGLLRFYGKGGVDEAPVLAKLMRGLAGDLREGRFDDLVETFYDWVFRATWTALMTMRIEEEGGEHADPAVLYQCTDPLNEAALDGEVRERTRAHLEECAFCRELLEQTCNVPIDVRHAGAPCPEEFRAVIARAMELYAPG